MASVEFINLWVNGERRQVPWMANCHLEELERLMRENLGRGLPLHVDDVNDKGMKHHIEMLDCSDELMDFLSKRGVVYLEDFEAQELHDNIGYFVVKGRATDVYLIQNPLYSELKKVYRDVIGKDKQVQHLKKPR